MKQQRYATDLLLLFFTLKVRGRGKRKSLQSLQFETLWSHMARGCGAGCTHHTATRVQREMFLHQSWQNVSMMVILSGLLLTFSGGEICQDSMRHKTVLLYRTQTWWQSLMAWVALTVSQNKLWLFNWSFQSQIKKNVAKRVCVCWCVYMCVCQCVRGVCVCVGGGAQRERERVTW